MMIRLVFCSQNRMNGFESPKAAAESYRNPNASESHSPGKTFPDKEPGIPEDPD